jgi:hypothetical protein
MAFGKPPIAAANVGGWRQRASIRQNEKQKTMGSRGFAGSRFAGIFRPPFGVTAKIRIIPGQYKVQRAVDLGNDKWGLKTEVVEYYETAEHFDGRSKRTTICSAGAIWFKKQFAQPCIGCRAYFASPKNDQGHRQGRFNRREIFIFSLLEYGTFAKVEQVDKNGLLRISEKTGKAYTEWVRKTPGLQGILDEKEGHVQHWTVGHGHMEVIQGYDSIIGRICTTCGTRDSIQRRALLCSNPRCGTDIVDCRSTVIQPADQDKMLCSDVECPHCHTVAPLQEFVECVACSNPARASIFDVDIDVQRLDTPGQTQLLFTSWSHPHPIDPAYKVKPLDLPTIFQPDSLEKQEHYFQMTLEEAEALGGEEFTPAEARQHSRAYSQ